jgi:DNA-binding NarL/FixJ family response regulator
VPGVVAAAGPLRYQGGGHAVGNAQRTAWRVLIAGDHSPASERMRAALGRDERFEITADAGDAAAAVREALRDKPDVSLLDLRMPGGGLAAIWEIAARLPEARVVVLSDSEEDPELFGALRAGVDGYLLKTMATGHFPDALDRACSGAAPVQRGFVPHVLERFRTRDPRSRRPAGGQAARRRLTSREREILELLAQGWSTAEIAGWLVLSPSAVRVHIAAIVRKLGVADRAAAADFFRRRMDVLTRLRARRSNGSEMGRAPRRRA